MKRISPRKWAAAFGVTLGWICAAGAYGALAGYVGVVQTRHAPEQKEIRELQESIGKGVGGDLARAKAAMLEKRIAEESDPAPALAAAKGRSARDAIFAFLVSLPFFYGWFRRERLTARQSG